MFVPSFLPFYEMMLADKYHCSGCSACHDICPKRAIEMKPDDGGFLYPLIDQAKCEDCGLCTRVCPVLKRNNSRMPLFVYAAKAKDDEFRLASSSGGVFPLLARKILSIGGMVFGAAFNEDDWSVQHVGISDEVGISKLRGSKYVQSRTAWIYREVKEALDAARPVVFTGTPCQIAALRSYLGCEYKQLYLVDVVCHGVPSPMVWQKYLGWLRDAAAVQVCSSKSAEDRRIKRIFFRHKNLGWKRYSLSVCFANGNKYRALFSVDPFMRSFLAELCNRPSCHDCRFRELRSGADLTIGDFWGVGKFHPGMDDDFGTSLVLVNTSKGAQLWECIFTQTDCRQVTFDEAVSDNSALIRSFRPHLKRDYFLRHCDQHGFDLLVERMLKPPFALKIRMVLGRKLRKMGLLK